MLGSGLRGTLLVLQKGVSVKSAPRLLESQLLALFKVMLSYDMLLVSPSNLSLAAER